MRVLVTGARGFVGRCMVQALRDALADRDEILPTSRSATPPSPGEDAADPLDVTDIAAVHRHLRNFRPTHVVHLAGLSTIAAAAENEELAWRVHVQGTLNLARAILEHVPQCLLVNAGSGQVYGATGRSGRALDETAVLAPTNIQMVTKVTADLALGALAEDGLRCVRFRPFNHTGRDQSLRFALPNFAAQIARIKSGRQEPVIRVGNLDTERDFLDVRDVVSAYLAAVLKSDRIEPGVVMNVASGIPRRMQDVLAEMFRISGVTPELLTDPALVRASEIPRFVGDASKARRVLDWEPRHPFNETLRDIIQYWDSRAS